MPLQADSVLNFIAMEEGFFKKNGLNLEVSTFPSGKRAYQDGFAKGNFDLVVMLDSPFVFAVDKNPDLRIIANIYGSDNGNRIVTRKDVNFDSLDQLPGHKIGTQKSSAVHYFFHRVYTSLGISRDEFSLAFYKAEELPQALASGEIDAFSMREPFVSQASQLLDGEVNIFSMPGIYHQYGVVVARESTIEHKSEALKRYLKSLMEARTFAISNNERGVEILAKYLQVSKSVARQVWRPSHMQFGLYQGLVNTIEEQILWRNHLTDLGLDNHKIDLSRFDVLDYLDVRLMEQVSPFTLSVVYERSESE